VGAWTQQSNKDPKKLTTDWRFVSDVLQTVVSCTLLQFKKALKHVLHVKHKP